jgi:transmembrane sensor
MDISKAASLFAKFREGTITEEEKALLEHWYYEQYEARKDIPLPAEVDVSLDEVWDRLSNHPSYTARPIRPIYRLTWFRVSAACLLLLLTAGWMIYLRGDFKSALTYVDAETEASYTPLRDTLENAYLTLSNGRKVQLEEQGGLIAEEGSLQIKKTQEGSLVYSHTKDPFNQKKDTPSGIHEVFTPIGTQLLVRLPDETSVWLNAGSQIRFPAHFDQTERWIELNGEAFFDVSKNTFRGKRVPFKVKTNQQITEVLGTQFNVTSYADENTIRTTLVEGSVSVNFTEGQRDKKILLRPGQQLRYKRSETASVTEQIAVREIDTRSATAWKNGLFRFDNTSLHELMRQICRWYNVDVEYVGQFGNHQFVGEVERTATLPEVLSILETGGLTFRIENKKIIVRNESE